MMKLYSVTSRQLHAEHLILAENEWQARDIADDTDHSFNLHWAQLCNQPVPGRIPYYTLGNGNVYEVDMTEFGVLATVPDSTPDYI
jgi:hypothetical protein